MTTSELIKQLQEADPEGNTHIRIARFGEDDSGIPDYVCKLPGYWDGTYAYEDEDKNLVFTSADSKVDINILCYDNWVVRHLDDWESKLKFNYTFLDKEGNKQRADSIIKSFKEHEYEYRRIDKQVSDEHILKMIRKLKDGCTLQEKEKCGYKVLELDDGKKSMIGNGYSHVIMTCGLFKRVGSYWVVDI